MELRHLLACCVPCQPQQQPHTTRVPACSRHLQRAQLRSIPHADIRTGLCVIQEDVLKADALHDAADLARCCMQACRSVW